MAVKAATAAAGTHQPQTQTASASAANEQWVISCCAVEVDGEGCVVTPMPALMAAAVSRLVEQAAISDADAHPASPPRREVTRLHGCRPPGITLEQYADRLLRYSKNSPVAYLAGFALMLRLQPGFNGNPIISGSNGSSGNDSGASKALPVRIDSLTAHRMMAVGCVVATKFFDDKFFTNSHYAQVAGVSLPEFNAMELDFLRRIDYRACVTTAELCTTLHTMLALAGNNSSTAGKLPLPPTIAVSAATATAPLACPASHAAASSEACTISGSEGSDDCSTLTSAHIGPALAAAEAAAAGDDKEEVMHHACADSAAVAPLPWAGTCAASNSGNGSSSIVQAGEEGPFSAAAAAAAVEAPRRSKKRCSAEAAHPHLAHEERQHLADAICQA